MVTAENIIDRQFKVETPYRFAGTDVTYLWIPRQQRYAYLANVRDMATGEYLGWSVSYINDQELANGAILDIERRHEQYINLMLHSDRDVYVGTLPEHDTQSSWYCPLYVSQGKLHRQRATKIQTRPPQRLVRFQ